MESRKLEFELLLSKIEELKEQLEYQTSRADTFEYLFHEACELIPPDPGYEIGATVRVNKPKHFKTSNRY